MSNTFFKGGDENHFRGGFALLVLPGYGSILHLCVL